MEFEPAISLVLEDDIDDLSRDFMEKLRSVSSKPEKRIQATIFRVPENIRRTNVDSFEPKMVSLGPYHHGKQRFRATDERIKLSLYASNFFRTDVNLVRRMVQLFKHWESDLLCAYSEQISMTSNEFVEMMVLDYNFMAEFLREQARGAKTGMEWAAPSIVNDMLVVENQLPLPPLLLLLVEHSDDLIRGGSATLTDALIMEFLGFDLMVQIHRNLSPTWTRTRLCVHDWDTTGHLLHLFHSWLVYELGEKARHLHNLDLQSFPGAEMLQAMRIQFVNKTHGISLLDITFDKNKRSMEIPQLLINDDNISLLRNLLAFEQQCHWVANYISTYVWFMDCLINTAKDVAVLRQHKIIVSRLHSDEEVAHIFNELRRTDAPVVDFDRFYLAEVMTSVESYCRNRSNRLWALWNFSWLRQNYFKNRWVTIDRRHCSCFLQPSHFGANCVCYPQLRQAVKV